MDQYEINFPEQPEMENQPIPQQPIPEDVHEQTEYTSQPVFEQPVMQTRKESPFADSPYVMYHQPQYQYSALQTPSEAKPKKKRSGKVWKVLLSSLLVVALVAAGCGITAYGVHNYWVGINNRNVEYINGLANQIEELKQQIKDNSFTGNGNSVSGSTNVSADGLTPGQVYAKCVNSVVAISARVTGAQGTGSSTGSGFIISKDGYIVSNYHVVEGAASLTVTTHRGEQYTAVVVGYDDSNDFALLKAEATDLTPVKLGNSSNLIVGDQVVAIGNPLGELSATLTVGYVSGKDRTITTTGTVINMIQTDAAINPGNSGGPLFNMKGEVVGITTAKYSGTTSSGATIEGIGFAIPIDDVKGKVTEILENGYISTPYMGIEVTNQFDGMGVYVAGVEKGGAAEAAGIKVGDLIVKMGDTDVTTLASLTPAIKKYKVGDTTTLTVYRSGKLLELTLTFGEKPHGEVQLPQEETQEPTQSTVPGKGDFKDWWDHFFGDGSN